MLDAPRFPGLAGRRVLLVEDDYMIADVLREELEGAGAEVLGPAPDVETALRLLAAGKAVDAAVLDVNLGGTMSWPVAEVLFARGVSFVFATGYDAGTIPGHYAGVPCCEKPVELAEIARALSRQANP